MSLCLAYYAHRGCFRATQTAVASLSNASAAGKLCGREEEKLHRMHGRSSSQGYKISLSHFSYLLIFLICDMMYDVIDMIYDIMIMISIILMTSGKPRKFILLATRDLPNKEPLLTLQLQASSEYQKKACRKSILEPGAESTSYIPHSYENFAAFAILNMQHGSHQLYIIFKLGKSWPVVASIAPGMICCY